MAKMKQPERNKQIFADRMRGDAIKDVAARYSVHPSRVSQIVKEEMQARSSVNQSLLAMSNNNAMFPTAMTQFSPSPPKLSRQDLMNELGTTGLWRFGGTVREEFLRELQARKGVQLFREMRENHPVINAVMFAIEMSLRQVRWFVQSATDKPGDKEAADFLEGCLDDMSFTWQDTLAQILTMLQYGFSLFELVYKVRRGQNPPRGFTKSQYDDGRIGWRKWLPLAQDTLAPGREWIWDENGGIQGINQLAPPDWILRTLPIEKMLLFRTSVAKNSPEGRSILRGMYQPWYYSKNLSEIEAIALERWGTGVPVMYMGDNTNKDPNSTTSDLALAKQIVRDVRADEQSGVVIPYAKMGGGAKEGDGMLFELVSPPSRGIVDFDQTIQRYNKQMALTVLAQFIMLGLSEGRGSFALSKDHSDLFIMSLASWAESIVQVVNRFALPRLFELNNFDLTDLPQLTHSEIAVPDLAELGTYINNLAGAGLITADENLEADLREKAHLPPKATDTQIQVGTSFTEETPDQEAAQDAGAEVKKTIVPNQQQTEQTRARGQAERYEIGKRRVAQSRGERFQDAGGRWITTDTGTHVFIKEGQSVEDAIKTIGSTTTSTDTWEKIAKPSKSAGHLAEEITFPKITEGTEKQIKYAEDLRNNLLNEVKNPEYKANVRAAARKEQISPFGTESHILAHDAWNRKMVSKVKTASARQIIDALHPDIRGQAQRNDAINTYKHIVLNPNKWKFDGKKWVQLQSERHNVNNNVRRVDQFQIQTRRAYGGARYETQVNEYQKKLESIYSDWYSSLSKKLEAEDDPDKREAILLAALVVFESDMKAAGRNGILEAMQLGAGDAPLSPDALSQLAQAVSENDNYIEGSLIPAIRNKAEQGIKDDYIVAGGAIAMAGLFATFLGRVSSYAGAAWTALFQGVGDALKQEDDWADRRVEVRLDPGAEHCDDCVLKADIYDNWDQMLMHSGIPATPGRARCSANCRCTIYVESAPNSGVFERFSARG